jgi:hypothetical protein
MRQLIISRNRFGTQIPVVAESTLSHPSGGKVNVIASLSNLRIEREQIISEIEFLERLERRERHIRLIAKDGRTGVSAGSRIALVIARKAANRAKPQNINDDGTNPLR